MITIITLVDALRRYSRNYYPDVALPDLLRLLEMAQSTRGPVRTSAPPRSIARRLSPKQVQDIAAAYRSGTPSTKLMAQFGVGKGTILRILQDQDVRMRRQGLDEHQRQRALQLRRDGMSIKRVAAQLDAPKSAVQLWLSENGLGGKRC